MDSKSVGSSAGLLALIALLFHTFGGAEPERRAGQKDPQAMPDLSAFASHGDAKELPLVLQGPWSTTRQFFHRGLPVPNEILTQCLLQPDEICLPPLITQLYAFPTNFDRRHNFNALIATIPDPLHTRMSMETDRDLDAIQQAAFDVGYELATQWLPWTVKAATEKTGAVPANTDKSWDWERLPGLLLFRHHFFEQSKTKDEPSPDSLLLVFVVGETPTAGVNGYQFELARATIRALSDPSAQILSVAGPNFSGSFPSIAHLLEDSASSWEHIEMSSGTATNKDYADQMLSELENKPTSAMRVNNPRPFVTFHGSLPPNSSFRNSLKQLAGKLHIEEPQVAEILETETGFATFSGNGGPFPIFRYPRDIAQLRNTYNDAAFASSAGQTNTASPPPVDFSLKDTQAGEDDFPTFSTSHTPLSQNAVLEQIAQRIKQNHIRLISLSASNIFDRLFLVNFLAHNCPDTRVVLPSADLLFVEDAAAQSLSGLMAISPFPLFPEGTSAKKSGSGSDTITFASSDQIAEFNAVLSLLGMMNKHFADQAATYQQDHGPSVANGAPYSDWVLVLSSRGWTPVDLFSQPNNRFKNGSPWYPPVKSKVSIDDSLSGLKAGSSLWLALSAAIALTTCFLCHRIWRLKRNPEERVWSSFCLEDPEPNQAQSGGPSGVASQQVLRSRYFCMNACFSNLAVANALFLCPMLARNGWDGFYYWAIWSLLFVAFGWAAITSAKLVRSWLPPHARSPESVALNLGVQFIALGTVAVWCYCCFSNGVASTMLNFRTLTLAASVCPLWPLFFGTLGLFGMAFFQLRRFTWCDRRQPYIDTSLFDELLDSEFTEIRKRLETRLMSPTLSGVWKAVGRLFGAKLQNLAMLCWPLFLLLGVTFVLGNSFESFELRAFTYTVELLFTILALFTLSNLFRFLACWTKLRAFLINLNSILLGRFFEQVSEFSGGGGPVWVHDVKLMSLSTVINGYIALYNLGRLQKMPLRPGAAEYLGALKGFLKTPTSPSKHGRRDFVESYRNFRLCASDICVELGKNVLNTYWTTNRLDFVAVGDPQESANAPIEPKATLRTDAQYAPVDLDKAVLNPCWTANRMEFVSSHHVRNAAESAAEPLRMAAAANSSQTSPADRQSLGSMSSWVMDRLELVASSKPDDTSKTSSPSRDQYELASRYVTLHYSAYIGYVLHQLQNLLVGSTVCFVLSMLGLNSFVFQAPQTIFHLVSAGVVIGGIIVLVTLAQMERDPILSRLSGSKEGHLGKDFYVRALTFGIPIVLTVLATEFPSIVQYISMWITPMSAALR